MIRPALIRLLALSAFACLCPTLTFASQWDSNTREVVFAGVSDVTTTTRCERLILSVEQETTNRRTETWLQYFVIDECADHEVVASGAALIPNDRFSLNRNRSSVRLQTGTPEGATGVTGAINLTWWLTDLESWSSTGTWRNQIGPSRTFGKRADDQRSALVIGTVAGFNVSGPGQFGWTSLAAMSREEEK